MHKHHSPFQCSPTVLNKFVRTCLFLRYLNLSHTCIATVPQARQQKTFKIQHSITSIILKLQKNQLVSNNYYCSNKAYFTLTLTLTLTITITIIITIITIIIIIIIIKVLYSQKNFHKISHWNDNVTVKCQNPISVWKHALNIKHYWRLSDINNYNHYPHFWSTYR